MASVRKCHIVLRAAAWWRKDSFDPRRLGLGRHRWLSVDHPISRLVLPRPLRQKHRRLFRVGPKRFVVARGNLHGRDDLRGGYATGGYRTRVRERSCGELAVVEFSAIGNDDRLPLRAPVAPLRAYPRRAIRRDALPRQARRVLARFPRRVSRPADELPHPWLGHEGHGLHHQHFDGHQRSESTADMRFLFDAFHGHLCFAWRSVGCPLDRCVSIRLENGHRNRCGVVWPPPRRRHPSTSGTARGTPPPPWPWPPPHPPTASRFFPCP